MRARSVPAARSRATAGLLLVALGWLALPIAGLVRPDILSVRLACGLLTILGLTTLAVGSRVFLRSAPEEPRDADESPERSLLDKLPVGVFIVDPETRVIEYINQSVAALFGAPQDQIVGRVCHQFLCPAEVGACPICDLGQGVDHSERVMLRVDGSRVPILKSVTRIRLRGQDKLLETFVDISEQKRIEEALRVQQAKIDSIFRAAPVGIGVVADRVLTEANQFLADMTGYSREELIGQSARILYPSDDEFDFVGREKYRQIAERGVGSVETRWRRKDGQIIHVLLSSSPIVAGDLSAGVRFTGLDITERRRLEQEVRQAQKMEAIGRLAGGVAHDFNNILTAILMQVSLLQTDFLVPSTTQDALAELESQAKRAAALTRQLLLFSRREVAQVRPIDLNDLLDQMLKMLRRLLEEHITMEFDTQRSLPLVEADPGMIEQVVMNLCVNARDAMPKGGRLTIGTDAVVIDDQYVRAHPEARAGQYVRLTVTDTGCGMNETTLLHAFEPFFTTKEIGKGTGLGLATAFGIVQLHRGWIEVSSAVDSGSSFRVYLPASTVEVSEPAAPQAGAGLPGGPETILVVEDDESVRRMVARVLKGRGYRVLEAANGVEALRLWKGRRAPIDLLFTDMVMPEGVSGLELCERLRAERPELKVIISSGYSDHLAAGGLAGREDIAYLPKPCAPDTLATTVRACLDAARAPDVPPALPRRQLQV